MRPARSFFRAARGGALLAAWLTAVCIPAPAAEPYLPLLLQRAEAARLWEDPYWRLLLRYRRTWWGAVRGETPSPEFYLDKNGRRNPKAEMAANLSAFLKPIPEDPQAQHPQCLFPERYAWLKSRLEFDPAHLTEMPCPRFENFRRTVNPGSITIVYAASYINSPASMYGHTFLRFDHEGRAENQRLLDYTLNFAAYDADANPVLYAVRGLSGGYQGRYSLLPYYAKVQEYSNLESRDLWEYRLDLDEPARERLLRFTWEQAHSYFPYYFFNRNCSYQLLPLLDQADSRLSVTPSWRAWIIPADTLRWIQQSPAHAMYPRYRPSRLTVLKARRAALSRDETKLAWTLSEGSLDAGLKELVGLSPGRQAAVLDTVTDYLLYKEGPRPDPGADILAREGILLARRATLDVPPPPPVERPATSRPPHEGHPTARLMAGFGASDNSSYQELSLRVALHDLLDPPEAYEPGGQLEMAHVRLRYDNGADRTYLQSLTIIDILSLPPHDPWISQLSWKVRSGLETADELGLAPWRSLYYDLRIGRGLSTTTSLGRGETWYAFAEGDAGLGSVFRDRYRLGAGASAGTLLNLTSFWRARFECHYLKYLGDDRENYGLRLEQNLALSRRLGARVALDRRTKRREYSASIHWYF